MPVVAVHHTATVDEPWDGPAEEAKLASPLAGRTGRAMYAWYDGAGADPDGDGYPDAKADWKFPHHMVDASGRPGAANIAGCRAILSRVGGSSIPAGDRAGVEAHAQAHMDDHMATMSGAAIVTPRSYAHVTKALMERPWAIQAPMLSFMVELVRFRSAGGHLAGEDIEQRLAAAAADNGPRAGGTVVGSVAVIPIYGLISQRQSLMSDMSGGTSLDAVRNDLRMALADPAVRAVVFDIDSPGGSVDGLPELAAEIRQARQGTKPIVGQVNTLAASAAYWLASQCSELICTPSGEVGSVGVYAAHEDMSKAQELDGVKTTLISAGPFKVDGNPYEPLTDTARAAIQDQVDAFYAMFLGDVAKGRQTTVDAVAADYGQGRTLLAKPALAAGMVDGIDTLEATVARLQPRTVSARRAAEAVPIQIAASAASRKPDRAWNARVAQLSKRRTR